MHSHARTLSRAYMIHAHPHARTHDTNTRIQAKLGGPAVPGVQGTRKAADGKYSGVYCNSLHAMGKKSQLCVGLPGGSQQKRQRGMKIKKKKNKSVGFAAPCLLLSVAAASWACCPVRPALTRQQPSSSLLTCHPAHAQIHAHAHALTHALTRQHAPTHVLTLYGLRVQSVHDAMGSPTRGSVASKARLLSHHSTSAAVQRLGLAPLACAGGECRGQVRPPTRSDAQRSQGTLCEGRVRQALLRSSGYCSLLWVSTHPLCVVLAFKWACACRYQVPAGRPARVLVREWFVVV